MQSNKTCPLLEQYLGYLTTIKSRSNNTVLEYRTDILHFFSYVAESRALVFMDFRFADLDFINSITLTDMYGFITHCQSVLHSSARDNCIITIFLNCGLRLSELAGLNASQISSDVLTVIGKGNKERRIFVTPAVKQSLAQWLPIRNMLEVHTDALFVSRNHQRITTRAIQNVVKKHITAAGPHPEEISAHKLRHTAATLMYKYGHVDIRSLQQILGHESIATTEIYTHIDEAQLQAAVNANPLAMMFS